MGDHSTQGVEKVEEIIAKEVTEIRREIAVAGIEGERGA